MTAITQAPTLGQQIAADVRALADLIEACPELAEQMAGVLNYVPVPVVGIEESAAIRAIGTAAVAAGAQYLPKTLATSPRADVVIGSHVLLGLYTRSDLKPVML